MSGLTKQDISSAIFDAFLKIATWAAIIYILATALEWTIEAVTEWAAAWYLG